MITAPLRPQQLGFLGAALAAVLVGAGASRGAEEPSPIAPAVRATLDQISAESLRGHLSFLASDLLEGRATPSRGLDLAALYIAAQFGRAGLEPMGDDGYFQTALWGLSEPSDEGFECVFHLGNEDIRLSESRMSLRYAYAALDLKRVPITRLATAAGADDEQPGSDAIKGKVVLIEESSRPAGTPVGRSRSTSIGNRSRRRLFEQQAALLVTLDPKTTRGLGLAASRRVDPLGPEGSSLRMVAVARTPELVVHDAKLIERLVSVWSGTTSVALSLHVGASVRTSAKVRNVIGMLRGSDPRLKDTYVLVTAHYDHLGRRPAEADDDIFNGANDDGSGTVSVIELAAAMSKLQPRPKRSLVFIAFFGEEHGMLGSRYYVGHPVVPLESTVADLNLEQVGRTDSSEGPQLAAASLTGFDYSTLGPILQEAGRRLGIHVSKSVRFSDSYFGASDNIAFALRGIPAHTLCVAYQYPDYHGPGDHWEKIDFANMAIVDRAVALGLVMIAEDPERPRWNEANPKAQRYARAHP
jgi:hypothetical protein